MRRDAALVPAGNSVIGFECARQIARAGWYVLIASRDRATSAPATIRTCVPTSSARAFSPTTSIAAAPSRAICRWSPATPPRCRSRPAASTC